MSHTPENTILSKQKIPQEGTTARAIYEENIRNPLPTVEPKKTRDPILAERLRNLGIPVILIEQ